MQNLLTKTLFISLVLSTVIPSEMQADQPQIKSRSDFWKAIVTRTVKKAKEGAVVGAVVGIVVGVGEEVGIAKGGAIGVVGGGVIGVVTGVIEGVIEGAIGVVNGIFLNTSDSSRNNNGSVKRGTVGELKKLQKR